MTLVEILYFDGCPNVDLAVARARAAAVAAGASVDLRMVPVEGEAEAQRQRFIGSPTVRVDGVDVEPSARARTDFGMQCRVYSVGDRLEGAPPVRWVKAAMLGEPGEAPKASHVEPACGCSPAEKG